VDRLGPRVCFTKRKGLKYKFQYKSIPTIGPRVCFVKTERLNCKTMSRLILHAGSRSDGAGTTDFQPAIRRLTASADSAGQGRVELELWILRPEHMGTTFPNVLHQWPERKFAARRSVEHARRPAGAGPTMTSSADAWLGGLRIYHGLLQLSVHEF
jgi:hypothetical protein